MIKKLLLKKPKTNETLRRKDGLWIPHRRRTYLYWFKFLREAELSSDHQVDWSKYEGWGGPEAILNEKFDDWWRKRWKALFAIENRNINRGRSRFEISTSQPKLEAIRLSYLTWQYRDTPSDWTPPNAPKNRIQKKFTKKSGNVLAIAARIVATEKRKDTPLSGIDANFSPKDRGKNEIDVRFQMNRYKRLAKKILENVCIGKFP